MPKVETIRSKDLRKYSILPIKAVQDANINRTAALAVLAVICSYTDELGRTFVSQARIAKDLGISRQAANRQVKRLLDLGYLVYAKKQYKGQTTNTVKVIYDEDVKDLDEARSNLTSKEQMELAERERELVRKSVIKSVDIQPDDEEVQPLVLQGGATSEVAGGATSRVAYNETLTSNNNGYKDKARMMCVMFSRVADANFTPRTFQERDQQVMESWIRQGLEPEAWGRILENHISWCRENARDMARGIGYFTEPVKRELARSKNPAVNKMVGKLARKLKA